MQIDNDNHIQAFKSFLLEAAEFYQTLIVKLRKHYGVPEEALFHKKGCVSTSFEPEPLQKCQYLCHRCLVCMGDLARYKQHYENLDAQKQNWSVSATHYLEATRIWPDSGNPQNQVSFCLVLKLVLDLLHKKRFFSSTLFSLFQKNKGLTT